ESVMQLALPDGVTNATSSPRSVVTPPREAERYGPASAGAPGLAPAVTAPTGAPGPGALAEVDEVGDVVDGAALVVLGFTVNDGDRSASPPTDCEHPATSTDA